MKNRIDRKPDPVKKKYTKLDPVKFSGFFYLKKYFIIIKKKKPEKISGQNSKKIRIRSQKNRSGFQNFNIRSHPVKFKFFYFFLNF
jgi:hypothetical protein